mgnify:CR=1 FL=1
MKTLFDKVWDAHAVHEAPHHPSVLYVDLHLVHEVTSPQAFAGLEGRGLPVRRPARTLATMDHSTPTRPGGLAIVDDAGRAQLEMLARRCAEHGIELFDLDSPHNGIVHVVAPEQGRTHPGMTVVCGDSHTSTHGAFGALAFGIGTSEVEQVLATQCLLAWRPLPFEVRFDGTAPEGVGAKDLILALIAEIGVAGGTGHVFEYRGDAVRALSMEGRMTLCNMSIEAGARAGMIAPDETTFAYLEGRPGAPTDFEEAVARWRALRTDPGAFFARSVSIDASRVAPRITWGTTPAMSVGVDEPVPQPTDAAARRALDYMRLEAGKPLLGQPIDVAFIGSCTNSRIEDLREAARVMRGRRVSARTLVVPGSRAVQRQAESEGLHRVFEASGAEWRDPGCSMCLAMNGDRLEPGQLSVSTSNRNFEGRQGPGGRTLLASPLTTAASAVAGAVADARRTLAEAA